MGGNDSATISNSYVTGAVSGSADDIGGLVGDISNSGSVSNSYATGSVHGVSDVGGLVGNHLSGSVSNSYATGAVTGTAALGGLVGLAGGSTTSNSYWDKTTTGQLTSAAGTGVNTTALMQTQSTFTGFDFTTTPVWRIYAGHTYPLLESFLTPLTVTANAASKAYDGLAYSGGNGVSYSVTPNANLLGTVSYGGTSQGAINVGSYTITPSGYWSNQQGYDIIAYANGTLSILPVSYTGTTATGGSATATVSGGGAGCGFTAMEFVPVVNPPAGVTFPYGLFNFTLSGCTPGSTVTLNITYPSAIPAGTQYWKYGSTPDNSAQHWYTIPSTISGNTITFTITDGEVGDDDWVQGYNGTIVDAGGPGQALPLPSLSEWGVILLTGLLGVFGVAGMRRRDAA